MKRSLDELLRGGGSKSLATSGNQSRSARTMCSLWSRHHRGSSSSSTEQESQRESVWICNNKSRIVPCLSPGTYTTAATEQGPTGKAEYSERGPLSLREHGGETYSWST